MFQDLLVDGQPLYVHVAKAGRSVGRADAIGDAATARSEPSSARPIPTSSSACGQRCRTPGSWFPAMAARGPARATCAERFDEHGLGAIINNSRDDHFCPRPQGILPAVRRRPLARGGRSGHARHDRPAPGRNVRRKALNKNRKFPRTSPARASLGPSPAPTVVVRCYFAGNSTTAAVPTFRSRII